MQKEVDHDSLQSLDIRCPISFFILNKIFLFLFTILVLAFNIKGQKQFSREKSLLFYLGTGGMRSFIFLYLGTGHLFWREGLQNGSGSGYETFYI